jgi:hypothetical protein
MFYRGSNYGGLLRTLIQTHAKNALFSCQNVSGRDNPLNMEENIARNSTYFQK